MDDIFPEWKGVFSGDDTPDWVDKSKITRTTECFTGYDVITESYSSAGKHWERSYTVDRTDIKQLKKELKKVVDIEDYERAVILRDQIKRLK